MSRFFKHGSIFVSVVILDQLSKYWAIQKSWAVINQGIAFNWLNGLISESLMALAIGGVMIFLWRSTHRNLSSTLILSGAVANLIDRIAWGGVIDWLPLPLLGLKNNVADWAIFSGVIWFIVNDLCKSRFFLKTKT